MVDPAKEILPVNIEDELKQSYLDYAMSVIVGRALPDVRDGLKPVHRRVLFAMNELNNDFNKPYKKSARVVGDVIGKYHPHGDSAVYETIVRMAQPFSLRYMLVDGQGNFGSIDGDSAAAMRYTEIRMTKLAHALLEDFEKIRLILFQTMTKQNLSPMYCLLVYLTFWSMVHRVLLLVWQPIYRLTMLYLRWLKAVWQLLKIQTSPLMNLWNIFLGLISQRAPLLMVRLALFSAYRTGRGRIYQRAKADIEVDDKTKRETIIISEIPYQLNKSRLIERIAELVKEKKIEGISELRDESDKDGLRVVIELKRGEMGEVVLNNLYAQTQLQSVFGINMVALVDGQPKILNLKEMLEAFIRHRREVVTRRTIYLLKKARERAHTLEGFAIALANIDEIIALIKKSPTPADAREALVSKGWTPGTVVAMLERAGPEASRPEWLEEQYGLRKGKYFLSPEQAKDILELRLHRLTGMEQDKIIEEFTVKLDEIADYQDILGNITRLMLVIKEELEDVLEQFGDERRTEIIESQHDLTVEDLITEEDRVVTISHGGYAKTQPLTDYQAQRRGGMGKSATAVKDEDFVEHLLIASTHATILCFTNFGKVYWLKVYQIPVAGHNSRGRPMVNLLPLEELNELAPYCLLKSIVPINM